MAVQEIEIHAGHWKALNSGANGILNEVTENRRVAKRVFEILQKAKVPSTYFEDNQSTNQRDNINTIVKHHNQDRNGLIVSIHFNASGGTTNRAIGTEVLYTTQKALAAKLSQSISDATSGGLLNRGAKYRDNLGVLARTYEPAVLIEVCFVNSTTDAAIYKRDFEKICQAIAADLAKHIGYTIPKPKEETTVTKPKTNTPSTWAKEAVEWAKGTNPAISDGTRLHDTITREEVLTMLHRLYKVQGGK